jgi:hypothetical protein
LRAAVELPDGGRVSDEVIDELLAGARVVRFARYAQAAQATLVNGVAGSTSPYWTDSLRCTARTRVER